MSPRSRFSRLALALALGATAVAAHAALPPASQIRAAFTALDASANGALNAAEWERGTVALFAAADRNRNGFIDAADLPDSAIAPDAFLRVDRDRDGRLSRDEFTAARHRLFRAADIDRDDQLAFVEYELFIVLERVGWTDRNASEHIELSELRDSLARIFQQLDADQDGKLTETEAAYLQPKTFARFDTDQDNALTLEETIAGYRKELGA
jgi:hypothetical protein